MPAFLTRARLAISLALALVVAVSLWQPAVFSQAPSLLFGSYNGAAKAVTATTDGYLNVSIVGGTVTCSGDCTATNFVLPASPSTSTTGNLYKGSAAAATRFLHNYEDTVTPSEGQNLFLGMLSGNFTMSATNAGVPYEGSHNVGLGYNVLSALTHGYDNTVIGTNTGNSLTTGFQNIFIGKNAGTFITTGSSNVLVGKDVMFLAGATTVTNVTAVGVGACRDNTANRCTAFGDHALGQNTTGGFNTAVGANAGGTNKTGAENVAIGDSSLGGGAGANNGQNKSVAIGSGAMTISTTGSGQNVAIGTNAGVNATTDDNMVAIGYNSGRSGGSPLTNLITIGSGTQSAVSNNTVIGNIGTLFFRFFGMEVTTGGTITVANVGADSCGTSAASVVGNDNGGEITVGATSGTQCRVAFPAAAPTRRLCTANSSTTTIAVRSTYVDTTHTDFLGTFPAAEHVTFICRTF